MISFKFECENICLEKLNSVISLLLNFMGGEGKIEKVSCLIQEHQIREFVEKQWKVQRKATEIKAEKCSFTSQTIFQQLKEIEDELKEVTIGTLDVLIQDKKLLIRIDNYFEKPLLVMTFDPETLGDILVQAGTFNAEIQNLPTIDLREVIIKKFKELTKATQHPLISLLLQGWEEQ